MEAYLFYTLAFILVVFAVLTVTARNPVRSAVYLISALLAVAGLFFLLEAEFVGAVQVLVYVGGIMVLFLFVIMLVSLQEVVRQPRSGVRWKTALLLVGVLSGELVYLLLTGARIFAPGSPEGLLVQAQTQNTQGVGKLLYSTYLLPFEIASVLLLVAMIGAVVLSKKEI